MNATEKQLWDTIRNFELDELQSAYPFSSRLAKENKWSLEFTLRAIHEYKKFMFLLAVSKQALTPSEIVDQVWHLHLIYTRSYWDEFCKIIGRPIHHNPTMGGAEESEKFAGWYNRTHVLYKEYFKEDPPADIWPVGNKKRRTVLEKIMSIFIK